MFKNTTDPPNNNSNRRIGIMSIVAAFLIALSSWIVIPAPGMPPTFPMTIGSWVAMWSEHKVLILYQQHSKDPYHYYIVHGHLGTFLVGTVTAISMFAKKQSGDREALQEVQNRHQQANTNSSWKQRGVQSLCPIAIWTTCLLLMAFLISDYSRKPLVPFPLEPLQFVVMRIAWATSLAWITYSCSTGIAGETLICYENQWRWALFNRSRESHPFLVRLLTI